MKKEIGLWIDHCKAVVVIVSDEGKEVREITSHMEKYARYSDDTSEGGSSEDVIDRQFEHYLTGHYDAVNAVVRDGDAVYLFVPSRANDELKNSLKASLSMRRCLGRMPDSSGHQVGNDHIEPRGEDVVEASITIYRVFSQGKRIWIF